MPSPPREVKPHYLARNDKVRSPDCLVVFDTETRWSREGTREIHRPRCWAAVCVIRHESDAGLKWVRTTTGEEMGDLAEQIDRWGTERPETWIYAHNVAFDLAVSQLPVRLIGLGWGVLDFHFGTSVSWVVLRRGRHKLIVTDSYAWLSMPLDEIGKAIGRRKVKLPGNDDTAGAWRKRCLRDVEILATALLTVMDWWDRNELGVWGITGAACGWRAARHMMGRQRILVGPNERRTPFERKAIYGGRREAFFAGEIRKRLTVDYDFIQAHATVAANLPLPVKPGRRFTSLPLTSPILQAETYGVIARCRVRTDIPLVPVRHGREVWYPIGEFWTTLASPEIKLLMEHGALMEIDEGWAYRLGWALIGWARWILATSEDRSGETPELCRRMAKSWGRTVIGKFAQRTTTGMLSRPATRPGWHVETGLVEGSDAEVELVTIGGTEHVRVRDTDSADCFPAIFAFVESHTRAGLTRTMLSRPPGTIVQCDTDGFLEVVGSGTQSLGPPSPPAPFTIHEKSRHTRVRIISAQQLELGHDRKIAGVARKALLVDKDHYAWHDWPGLRWQLKHSSPGTYTRSYREVRLHGDKVRRWVLADGTTRPVTMYIRDDNINGITPAVSAFWGENPMKLSTLQHALLRPVMPPDGVISAAI